MGCELSGVDPTDSNRDGLPSMSTGVRERDQRMKNCHVGTGWRADTLMVFASGQDSAALSASYDLAGLLVQWQLNHSVLGWSALEGAR